jgi:hypothetical protein
LPFSSAEYLWIRSVTFGRSKRSASSRGVNSGAETTSAVIGPGVAADQALGMPASGAYTGSFMWAEKRASDHPRPNVPHFSVRALDTPHSFRRRTDQSAATRNPGELVSRGPLTSVR